MTLLARLCGWIGRKTNTIVLMPHPTAVGNCAEQIYYGLLKARREKKKLVILFQYALPWPLRYRLTNRELLAIQSDYRVSSGGRLLWIIGNFLSTAYVTCTRPLNHFLYRVFGRCLSDMDIYPMVGHTTLWQPEEVMPGFSWRVVEEYKWPSQIQNSLPVYLGAQKKEAAQRERRRLGLPENEWFVCLHVREGGFHNDFTAVDRNASIANYVDAIKEVTARGGWVVRMGDATMTPLPPMERVIDYPFTSSKSPLMDIYLISECAAYIGMQAGIFDIAMLFQRPIILTNMASWLYPYPQKRKDVGVFKHLYSKSRNRFLSVREWMAEPWEAHSFLSFSRDYVLYENTPEELRELVREFFEQDPDAAPTALQRSCWEQRVTRGKELLGKSIIEGDTFSDLHQRYRLASRLDSALGVISDAYLQNNWDRDSCKHV